MRFGILGPLEVTRAGQPVPVSANQLRTLLAVLLVRTNRVVPWHELTYALWDEDPPEDPKGTVQTYVRRLRAVLGRERITTHPHGYSLTAKPDEVDLDTFRLLVADARQAPGQATRIELLTRADELWAGEPLSGLSSTWLARHVVPGLVEERLQALDLLIEARLATGDHADVLPRLATLTRAYPLRERLWRHLMIALYRSGRQADALAAYDDLAGLLATELGLDPSPDLRDLRQAILISDPALAAVDDRADDDGWQVHAQLPLDVYPFVGRGAAIDRAGRVLLDRRRVPIAALSGPPGVGKTALAVHLAHRLTPHFPDGQWFVSLHGASLRPRPPGEVLGALLRLAGVRPAEMPDGADERAAALRSALRDRRILLLLDDARNAEHVRSLLPGTPGSAVIVTSRTALAGLAALQGGTAITLDVLPPDEAATLITSVLDAPGEPTEPVRRLAEVCGYLPLALRIAAANVAAREDLTVAALADRLGSRDGVLGLAAAGDPSTAVRASFAQAYRGLPSVAQTLFRRLGVVPGRDFTADAAEALLGTHAAVTGAAVLEMLADASLLHRRSPGRYAFHDLLRLYAIEQVERDHDAPAALTRLLDRYQHLLDAAIRFRHTPLTRLPRPVDEGAFADAASAMAWLDDERDNLMAALVACAADPALRPRAWHLADGLRLYLSSEQHLADWRTAVATGLEAARTEGDHDAMAVMYQSHGALEQTRGHASKAAELASQALTHFRAAGHRLGEGITLVNIGLALDDQGECLQARDSIQEGIGVLRTIGPPPLLDIALLNLSGVLIRLGELEPAVRHATESGEVTRSPSIRRATRHNLANAYRFLGRAEQAREEIRACLAMDDDRHTGFVLADAALLAADEGDLDAAASYARRAMEVGRKAGRSAVAAAALRARGHVLRVCGDLVAAREYYWQARELAEVLGHRPIATEAQLGLALTLLAAGEREAARSQASEGLEQARRFSWRVLECQALLILRELSRGEEAERYARSADALARLTGYVPPPSDVPATCGDTGATPE
ncbi:AfsR/SARP family transcriptional regulator [Nonomuraea soli]|uniref:DNA-binding SARP family transcriptional activator/tetratricopeptide (TPR) repeat protein n=1 Tax=Nonomuraea soli TaxID=1032476 RepID=A0A7W0HRT9_9ACTN|nr:BTAD domain-containing putative transcriptional regulator [Nonomuraea soli]MBA2893182.1 DNA-binding SARP family transcriptional activator/tetratricopeptide (TPR) repeat protein [Nonomuraea soli]